jgi:hypothetical protein
MAVMKEELLDLSDDVWQRFRRRIEGLTDEEYQWQPAAGCWTIGARSDGSLRHDFAVPPPDPAPFTTIAWRLWHVIDMYGENRAPEWLAVAAQGDPIGLDDPAGTPPATADAAVALLDRAHDRWDAHLALVSAEALAERIGSVGGPYADRTRASYVLHMLDEFIHHGAEIAVLRDLWRWQHPLTVDTMAERVMRGDPTVVEELDTVRDGAGLVDTAARYGRWELLVDLIRAGLPVTNVGTTPLHRAAGAGELRAVQTLVESGADPESKDPDFQATPLQWAEFFHHDGVVAWLASPSPRSSRPPNAAQP